MNWKFIDDMDDATKHALATLLRTVLITVGALVTGNGWATETQWQTWTGAVFTIAPLVWSVIVSWRKTRKATEREAVALNAGITRSNQSPEQVPLVPKEEAKAVIAAVVEDSKAAGVSLSV